MAGDIKLNENIVVIEGDRLDVTAADIVLDAPGRRKASGGYRRALVHGFNDELVINFNRDYPGGVTVASRLQVSGKLSADDLEVKIVEYIGTKPGGPLGTPLPIFETRMVSFKEIFTEIATLKAKVAELEAKLKPS